jgi:class 3 adenylate cyclase
MRCPKCARDNPDDAKFCVGCGNPLGGRCAKCGAENPADASFCKQCGTRLGGIAAPSAATARSERVSISAEQADSAALEGERKTVTVLSADIRGSTELAQDLDPEEARAIIDPALKLMIDAVHHYGGHVAQSTGDGIFAMFGAPIANEDYPQRALHAALRIQNELKRYSGKVVAEGGIPMEVRIGATTGEVVARSIRTGEAHAEYAPVGHTANLAARMQAAAPTGSIAVSEMTRKLCEGYFSLRPLGPTSVKGVSERVSVYEVTGLGPLRTRLQRAAGQGLTKFVGREREMEALKHAAEQARAGRGQIAVVVADPGVGKSRLFVEFKAKNQSGWMVLEAFSVSHGKTSAYLPVVDMLHSYFEIRPEDDGRKKREKTRGKVLALDRSLEDALPLLFGLLGINDDGDPLVGMESGSRRRRTLDAIKRILLRESLNQPLMLIFEDLHWTDSETQELLNLLADSIGNSKIVLLVSYRPEYSHQWANKTYYAQLRLDPLGRQSAEEMLDALLGSESEFTLKRFITERAEGNPLFMEEVVHALFEEGALFRNGVTRATRPLSVLKVPPTVQGVPASRIDRLPMAQKELLQILAAIGREFPLSLIRAVSQTSPEQLDQTLNNLQLAEFIY